MSGYFHDCLDIEAAMIPPIPDDIRAIIADVVPRDLDSRCTTQCLRGNVAECLCHPPIDGHYRKDVVPVTCPERKLLTERLAREAMAREARHD